MHIPNPRHAIFLIMDSQYSGATGCSCTRTPCPKSFMWWHLYVLCEQTLKVSVHPPPLRVPDGNDSVRMLSLLPDKLKALFYGTAKALACKSNFQQLPGPGVSMQCELPTVGHGHQLGKFTLITGVGSDPQQPNALPGPLSSHSCVWTRLYTADVFFSYREESVTEWQTWLVEWHTGKTFRDLDSLALFWVLKVRDSHPVSIWDPFDCHFLGSSRISCRSIPWL